MRHWLRLFRENGVDAGYRRKAAFVIAIGLITAHARRIERFRYGKRLRNLDLEHPPVFILGHWRTGTTLLHNLMTQDPALAYVSSLQSFAPECFLQAGRGIEPIMSRLMPNIRPMDGMAFGTKVPQEEEFAICNSCPFSFYIGWYFPRKMPELFRKYLLFEGLSDAELQEWARVYEEVVKKATLATGGKRLVLKNPVNTGRLRAVQELFPKSKFIHITRNPYEVFQSTMKLHRTLLPWLGFQTVDEETIRRNVLVFYRDMMRRFIEQRHCLPEENFTEVRFEELAQGPLDELARIYGNIGLTGWEEAAPHVRTYVKTLWGYSPDSYTMRQEDIDAVETEWGFAIDYWGYRRPA
jgi:hypothetical protein